MRHLNGNVGIHRHPARPVARLQAEPAQQLRDVTDVHLIPRRLALACSLAHAGHDRDDEIGVPLRTLRQPFEHAVELCHREGDFVTIRGKVALIVIERLVIFREARSPIAVHRRRDVVGEEIGEGGTVLREQLLEQVECQNRLIASPSNTLPGLPSLGNQLSAEIPRGRSAQPQCRCAYREPRRRGQRDAARHVTRRGPHHLQVELLEK